MNGGPIESVLARIEHALARIEQAAGRSARADDDLQARHERLKTSVSEALERLDTLIAENRG